MNDKPRQFWIYGYESNDKHSLVKAYKSPKDDESMYGIHVIEYSALTALEKQLNQYKEQCEKLVKVLHKTECEAHYHHEGFNGQDYPCSIYQALSEYQKFKESK